jgi:hypothetical protein
LASETQTETSIDQTSSARTTGNVTLSSLPTRAPQESERPTTTQTSESPAESAVPDETKITHFLCTKEGTTVETFEKFINDLDGGVGRATIPDFDLVGHQSYVTSLTPSQPDAVRQLDFILTISPWVFDLREVEEEPDEFYQVQTRQPFSQKHQESDKSNGTERSVRDYRRRAMTHTGPTTPYWKKMIAQPPSRFSNGSSTFTALADDSGGKGTTIYIVDDGFDLDVEVFYMIEVYVLN